MELGAGDSGTRLLHPMSSLEAPDSKETGGMGGTQGSWAGKLVNQELSGSNLGVRPSYGTHGQS